MTSHKTQDSRILVVEKGDSNNSDEEGQEMREYLTTFVTPIQMIGNTFVASFRTERTEYSVRSRTTLRVFITCPNSTRWNRSRRVCLHRHRHLLSQITTPGDSRLTSSCDYIGRIESNSVGCSSSRIMDKQSVFSLSVLAPDVSDVEGSRTQIQNRLRDFLMEFRLDNAFIYQYVPRSRERSDHGLRASLEIKFARMCSSDDTTVTSM